MTRTPLPKSPARTSSPATDSWLFDEPDLDEEGLRLLAAYRTATEALRQAGSSDPVPESRDGAVDATQTEAGPESPSTPRQAAVLRLHSVEGVSEDRFAGLHGQLLAAGYLTAEILGRADGLTYRVTREGIQRLAHAQHAEVA